MPAISDLSLGMSIQVRVEKKQVSGWIRFLGTTKFAEGDWVGVELEEPRVKNDGSVKDQRYFTCEEAHGLFVRPANVDVKRKARKTAQAQQDMKNLKLALAEAVEENDEDAILRLLPKAQAQGVPKEELELAARRLEVLKCSEIMVEQPEQPEPEDVPLIDLLGGPKRIKDYQQASLRVGQRVSEMLRAGEAAAAQPAIFQGMGIENMLKLATGFKKSFDELCTKLKHKLHQHVSQTPGYGVEFCSAAIKSVASAASKVNTEYHGDCRQLKDVVRGTLVITCEHISDQTIGVAYDLLEVLVSSADELRDFKAHFTRFSDRYQRPVGPSKYRDWLFLLKINDFICELQVNFKKAVEVKQDVQHDVYEKERLGTRKLLEATMMNDENMVRILLSTDIDTKHLVGARDCHGFTPLHYAARHGSRRMIELLLTAFADVAAMDCEGNPPLYHAVMMEHADASSLLLEQMMKLQKNWKVPGLQNSLQAIWGAVFHSTVEEMRQLAGNVALLAQKSYSSAISHLHGIVHSGDTLAMRAAIKTMPYSWQAVGWLHPLFDKQTAINCGLADRAILSGCVDMAQMVKDHGAEKGFPVSSQMQSSDLPLVGHDEIEELHRLVARGDIGQFRAAHMLQHRDPQELANLLMTACQFRQLEMAYTIWRTNEEIGQVLDGNNRKALAELGGDAAALGHVDFVRLVIEAHVPLNHISELTGRSMVERAALTGQLEIISALADANASVGCDALSFALFYGEAKAAELLIEKGADPHQEFGPTGLHGPLTQAIGSNRPEMLQLLAERGVDVASEESLQMAAALQAQESLAFLQQKLAERNS